jgi:hypothetical protein
MVIEAANTAASSSNTVREMSPGSLEQAERAKKTFPWAPLGMRKDGVIYKQKYGPPAKIAAPTISEEKANWY